MKKILIIIHLKFIKEKNNRYTYTIFNHFSWFDF